METNTTKWVKSGENWLWATWVGDAQVTYLLWVEPSPLTGVNEWAVIKKVLGAADSHGQVIGTQKSLDNAKKIAELDAEQPL